MWSQSVGEDSARVDAVFALSLPRNRSRRALLAVYLLLLTTDLHERWRHPGSSKVGVIVRKYPMRLQIALCAVTAPAATSVREMRSHPEKK